MARINLLPWREQLREERKQRFLVTLAAVLIASGGAGIPRGSLSERKHRASGSAQ